MPATSQMTFKIYNPHTKKSVWKSVNASGFKPNGRSCKSDQFASCPFVRPWSVGLTSQEVKHTGTPEEDEVYTITANLDKNIQISLTFTKPAAAPGFKYGAGEDGGISTFGKDREDGKRDGFMVQYVPRDVWVAQADY